VETPVPFNFAAEKELKMDVYVLPIAYFVILVFMIWLFVLLPMEMAKRRGRSQIAWLLISLFFSPILAIIGLLLLSDLASRGAP